MCRMLGVVSAQPRAFALLLEQAPHNMALLSEKHPDGWGIALGQPERATWRTHKSILRALDDPNFHQLATTAEGDIILVHVRQKTRGDIRVENTHPFESSPWVFTHNGTVRNTDFLLANISNARKAAIRGETDSERLFAFLLSCIDDVLREEASSSSIDTALREATRELAAVTDVGTASFLLSNGQTLYAHRLGAPLYLLQRSGTGESACTECARNPCIAVTTEPLTDEQWVPLQDGDLVRISKGHIPNWIKL